MVIGWYLEGKASRLGRIFVFVCRFPGEFKVVGSVNRDLVSEECSCFVNHCLKMICCVCFKAKTHELNFTNYYY